ncbi:tetratricopeptide repeat protein [Spirochaeta isovalerica]|uniref:Tetratricopeptide (TPR) repeat protein n=1 Tax=Spirochaeta isovalerica TaxID=150 RepID=A0A841R1E4_9SPIO|nr:tetratricopeptide repeat protein [Spirochaeta isovalerica]MBB6478804.1 tetratricopeptide (TPR) repeat protein [Spirochaeta isovalerica]
MDKTEQDGNRLTDLINRVYVAYRNGAIEESAELLNEAHSIDYDNPLVLSALKCTRFWLDRFEKLETSMEDFEKGEFLVRQWLIFLDKFGCNLQDCFEDGLYNLKQGIFRTALKYYSRIREGDRDPEPEILLRIGRCHKTLGDYDRAIAALEKALRRESKSSQILAELADCYFMVDKIRNSKVFFREAFFIDPQAIDVELLEADIITRLVGEVKKKGYTGRELNEWLPVYAVIFGVFNVKRELRPIEYGKLKQTIFSLKNELQESVDRSLLLPRLINHYFWLIDHYLCINKDWETVEEVLLNIKLLHVGIYEQYTN